MSRITIGIHGLGEQTTAEHPEQMVEGNH